MGKTSIEWTEKTWNPLRGCSEISPGCAHCYAAAVAARFSGPGQPYEGLAYRDGNSKPHWTGRLRAVPEKLAEPLSWRKPSMVFVNSMSDLFHDDVPEGFILEVFDVMRRATWAGGANEGRIGGGEGHTFQVLTKRADRAADVLGRLCWDGAGLNLKGDGVPMLSINSGIWVGVSVENQATADDRIPRLLRIPARVRFLSCEPLLERVDLRRGIYLHGGGRVLKWGPRGTTLDGIHWVIVGGESGKQARRCDIDWIRWVVDQCKAAGVPVFVKQLGGNLSDFDSDECAKLSGRSMQNPKGGDPEEWPPDLRVREWPEAAGVACA